MKLRMHLVLLLALAAIGSTTTAQTRHSRAGLSLRVHWLDPHYGSALMPPGGVLLRGEPLFLELTLVDKSHDRTAAAEVDWAGRVLLQLARAAEGGAERTTIADLPCLNRFVPIELSGSETVGDLLVLTSRRGQTLQCRLTLDEFDLSSGRYVVTARWNETSLTSGLLTRTFISDRTEEIEFEVRDVKSRADALDLSLNMATRALIDEKNPQSSLQFVERALAMEPRSVHALLLAGNAEMALGRCDNARGRWKQAEAVLATREDRRRGERVVANDAVRERLREELTQRVNGSCP